MLQWLITDAAVRDPVVSVDAALIWGQRSVLFVMQTVRPVL